MCFDRNLYLPLIRKTKIHNAVNRLITLITVTFILWYPATRQADADRRKIENSENVAAENRPAPDITPTVEVEEDIYTPQSSGSGAGPLWSLGSTTIVRIKGDVFVSAYEVIPDKQPYTNVRWALYQRDRKNWHRLQADHKQGTREPSPLACFPDRNQVLLSANPIIEQMTSEELRKQGITKVVELTEPPAIDGKIQGPWQDVPVAFNRLSGYEETHYAALRFAYDHNHLYVAADVGDPTPAVNQRDRPDQLWHGDNLELYISGNRRRHQWQDGDYIVHLPATPREDLPAAVFEPNRGTVEFAPSITMTVKIREDNAGYRLEAAVPLSLIGLDDLTAGEEFSLEWDVCYGDNDTFWHKLFRNDFIGNAITQSPYWWGIARTLPREPQKTADQQWNWFAGAPNRTETGRNDNSPAIGGPSQPQLVVIAAEQPSSHPSVEIPMWDAGAGFSQHSYRGFAADGSNHELLLFQQDSLGRMQHWSFRDRSEAWPVQGKLSYPPLQQDRSAIIRLSYPALILKNRQAAAVAVGNIVEPVDEWRKYKQEKTGRDWDYVRRRLYYTETGDITGQPFSEWNLIVNLDPTAGSVFHTDIHMTENGTLHILWVQTSTDHRLRDTFFPNIPIRTSLHYGIIREGTLVDNQILAIGGEGLDGWIPDWARFHQTPDERLFVIYNQTMREAEIKVENRLLEILPDGDITASVRVPLKRPVSGSFHTVNTRSGSEPSDLIDLKGYSPRAGNTRERPMVYARIRLID